ncbi:MAG: hypothetical protein C4527_05815 [Candidatus Omnitrophota bacterium]|jgi:uncharacterized Zn finger protein|nr:MAG: hypothetical protein C4527_05815 [Candidatus Omnitrophota bacterium]
MSRGRRYYSDDFFFYQPSIPREAKGGIKAQSQRGAFASSWWAKRWIAVLESFNIGARLDRGRSYARKGQVLSIEIDVGKIKAKVQGSRSTPYSVEVSVKTLTPSEWKTLIEHFASQPIFTAKLLAGEMPQDIEKLFEEQGFSLFPTRYKDLTTNCSCPDWSNPCKHIAAVFYLLGEEFDRDPFLMFKMRGMTREELFNQLPGTVSGDAGEDAEESHEPSFPAQSLQTDVTCFWRGGDFSDDLYGKIEIPSVSAILPKRLGNFPFWRGKERFLETLETLYDQASQEGLNVFVGEIKS